MHIKVEKTKKISNKIVAVIRAGGEGIFIPKKNGDIVYLNYDGVVQETDHQDLSEVACTPNRISVIEGEEITLKFVK